MKSSVAMSQKSSITMSHRGSITSRGKEVASPTTLAPEARPAAMPCRESSKTTVVSGLPFSRSICLFEAGGRRYHGRFERVVHGDADFIRLHGLLAVFGFQAKIKKNKQ